MALIHRNHHFSIMLVSIGLFLAPNLLQANPMQLFANNKNIHCIKPAAKNERNNVDELWCGMEDGSSHPTVWFSIGSSHLHFMPWLTEGQAIHGVSVSDSGKYLSIVHVGEGHPYLVVYDIEKTRQAANDMHIYVFNPYPGHISLYRWDGDTLLIETDYPVGKETADIEELTQGYIYSLDLKQKKLKRVGARAEQ